MDFISAIKSFVAERWNIGFVRNTMEGILWGEAIIVDWIQHQIKDSWFADPFILDVTDETIILLSEEWCEHTRRGRISRLTIERQSFKLLTVDPVLELDTHLSFPIIERVGDDVYIYPENGAAGGLWRYKYDVSSNTVSEKHQICNVPVADAVITEEFGERFMFATEQPNPNGNILSIFQWNEEVGLFVKCTEYSFPENVARMAGSFFKVRDKIYRPTQECNVQYGHAITIQEVEKNENSWNFQEVRRLYSPHPQLNVGMHTLNIYKDVIVTDALGFKNMWLRNIIKGK